MYDRVLVAARNLRVHSLKRELSYAYQYAHSPHYHCQSSPVLLALMLSPPGHGVPVRYMPSSVFSALLVEAVTARSGVGMIQRCIIFVSVAIAVMHAEPIHHDWKPLHIYIRGRDENTRKEERQIMRRTLTAVRGSRAEGCTGTQSPMNG